MDDMKYMSAALEEARKAAAAGETPVGCVIVNGEGRIIAAAHTRTEELRDATRHAELEAIRAAGDRRLEDCALYVTMEPCPMCAGACLHFRIGAVAFGAFDEKCGAFGSKTDLGNGTYGPEIPVVGGIMREKCASLLTEFFKKLR